MDNSVKFDLEVAPLSHILFARSYGRVVDGVREKPEDVLIGRTVEGLRRLGDLNEREVEKIKRLQSELKVFVSGRSLFVAGTPFSEIPKNFYSQYNCSSVNIKSWSDFGLLMNLAMQGTGTGAVLELSHIDNLPSIINKLEVEIRGEVGDVKKEDRLEHTEISNIDEGKVEIKVGDSREGWVKAYQCILELSSDIRYKEHESIDVVVDISNVRPVGEPLKGFGGVANPIELKNLFVKCAAILNKVVDREINKDNNKDNKDNKDNKLTSIECCLLIDEAAIVIVSGNIRRSAGMRMGNYYDDNFTDAKANLWINDNGNWKIDPERDALRMANHTRILTFKPSYDIVKDSVTKQYHSGEGALQNTVEAIARCNVDLLNTPELKREFIHIYLEDKDKSKAFLLSLKEDMDDKELEHRLNRYGLNPCFSGDSRLLTSSGYKTFRELKDTSFEVISSRGNVYPSKVWCSGEKKLIKLITNKREIIPSLGISNSQSLILTCTPDHIINTSMGQFKAEDCMGRVLSVPLFPSTSNQYESISNGFNWSYHTEGDWYIYTIIDELSKAKELVKELKDIGFRPFILLTDKDKYQVSIYRYVDLVLFHSLIKAEDTLAKYIKDNAPIVDLIVDYCTEKVYDFHVPDEHWGVVEGVEVHNCGEVIGSDFLCNLSEVHLNNIDGLDIEGQKEAFEVGGLIVAVLLNHKFIHEKLQYSRELDPIVGVSFTGLFDFFVNTLGIDWLKWWELKRTKTDYICTELPLKLSKVCEVLNIDTDYYEEEIGINIGNLLYDIEVKYFNIWKESAFKGVYDYCDKKGIKRPNRCTLGQPAGCLSAEALRIMDQGIYYLDEIVEPGSGDTNGLDMSVRNGVPVDKAIANEPRNLVKVTFKNKRTLRMTPDHRLSVNNKWIRADDLELGMNIDYSLGQYQKQEDALLIPLNYECYTREYRKEVNGHGLGVLSKTITTSCTLNSDIGYFLGCLFGNGHVTHKKLSRVRFSFSTARMAIVEKLQAIGLKHFGIEGRIDNYGIKLELCFASIQLVDWLKMNNLHKAEKSAKLDRIPLAIRQSSRETILSFFCGLIDTDGCIRKEGKLSIDSASEDFLRNLQQIAEAVGLSFSVFHNTQGENLQAQKDMWGLYLNRILSLDESLEYINNHSIKAQERPVLKPKHQCKSNPYQIISIEYETTPDYSFDITVEGNNDEDSWYWQGALKSHNSKSLLTGASSGWHPPKATYFIRRITFRREDPIALAAIDFGYSVVPSQSAKDNEGNLLKDPYDPRVNEWLIEVPVKVKWADIEGIDTIDIGKLSAESQWDFYMNIQREYVTHNLSGTIELTEEEIEPISKLMYDSFDKQDGYISVALLQRFTEYFPLLPMEPISQDKYLELIKDIQSRRKSDNFNELLQHYTSLYNIKTSSPQDSACEGIICELKF